MVDTKVYAFDVDETLEVSGGPVTLKALMDLRIEGHIVGICGNWGVFVQRCPGWQHLVSFLNVLGDKPTFLSHLKAYVPASQFIMVGNILGVSGGSDDQGAAKSAGWRFIKESDFAAGMR
jgi:hypothetical protein